MKRNPYSVVLLDEIEKAHPDLFNILLQVFEDGHLTDGLGNRVNFKNTIIIMTSNIGARFIQKKASLGFQSADATTIARSVNDMVLCEVRKTFNPEFINRIDEIIVFEALADDDLRMITRLLVQQLNANLVDRKIRLELAQDVIDWIIEQTCKDRSYGARPLRRAIQRFIEDPLSEELIRGHLKGGRHRGLPRRGGTRLPAGWRRGSGRPDAGLIRLKSSKLIAWPPLGHGVRGMAGRLKSPFMRFLVPLIVAFAATTGMASAQVPAQPTPDVLRLPATVCGLEVPAPANTPPSGTPTVLYALVLCFEKQGGASVIEPQTYQYYLELQNRVSIPSQNKWVPYTDEIETVVLGDFKRLWATNFLDDLSIDVRDVDLGNGVTGKLVVYSMEERQRIKIVDYIGSSKIDQGKIDEELKKRGIRLNLDSFIDPGLVRRVAGVVREVYAEKGYMFAEVKPTIKEVAGGPKLVHLTFNINEGPQVKIRETDFVGNVAVSDGKLGKRMKENKARGFFSFIKGGGTYKEDKFEDDADAIQGYYRDHGYIAARVGQPELKILEDEKDGKTRWVQLRVPITEGDKYRVGKFEFDGNTIVKADAFRTLFKLKPGDVYEEKAIRKGLEKAREVYGAGGYYEFTAYPDLAPRNAPPPASSSAGPPAPAAAPAATDGKPNTPIVDVTMRVQEGKQYFVNRITFLGNTTTRDNVIRREIRLVEAGVFNTEALKQSVKRLNQLGYFKPLEGEAIAVDKTPGVDNKVDVKLKFEEQNRNQLTFGAGVSQFEGFFGQLSFQTSNFLGRGETFTIQAQQGSRAKNYQVAFTEPFLFDRPMTVGVDLFIREYEYVSLYTQSSVGGNLVYGFQVADFARMFINYSLERVHVEGPESRVQRCTRARRQSVPG